jgi:glycolate oxidase iron-sulfur subunit
MIEAARDQVEPLRPMRSRALRRSGFHWLLPHPSLVRAAAMVQPLVRPFLPHRVRRLIRGSGHAFGRLPRVTVPAGQERGTVALLAGCVQDRWFHDVNLATIRVLAENGWRVTVPRGQACCGALAAHNGRLSVAKRLARRAARAFEGAQAVVANAAGCAAHMATYADLKPGSELPVRDLMAFLFEEGLTREPGRLDITVAYHDACHARAGRVVEQPRALLARIAHLKLVEIPDGNACCGAAGIYNVTQPGFADALGKAKAEAIIATGAQAVASANPGCTMQIAATLRDMGQVVPLLHPVQLLDRAYRSV